MDLCTKAKIKDKTVYCNCSAPTSENLEEDDYNFLNYKELHFEPTSDPKIEAFWKYLDCQNVPLPHVNRPKSSKKRKQPKNNKCAEKRAKLDEKQVKLDEKLKQNAELKTKKWADKLAYFQNKGYDKMLTQKKSCKICNNDEFGPMFADMNCREIVRGLPVYRVPVQKKVEIFTEKNEYISATEFLSETEVNESLPCIQFAQMSDKSQDRSKTTVHSLSEKSLNRLNSSHSMIDISQSTVYEKLSKIHYVYPNSLQSNKFASYSDTSPPDPDASILQMFDTPELLNIASNTDIRIGSHSQLRRQKKIIFHTKQEIRRSAAIINSICSLPSNEIPPVCNSSTAVEP